MADRRIRDRLEPEGTIRSVIEQAETGHKRTRIGVLISRNHALLDW